MANKTNYTNKISAFWLTDFSKGKVTCELLMSAIAQQKINNTFVLDSDEKGGYWKEKHFCLCCKGCDSSPQNENVLAIFKPMDSI